MKYIELFSGLGGMGYGLMKAGMECVGYCEIDKYAHKAFQILHDPDERMWNAYDVRGVTDDDIRLLGGEHSINLIAAGFPCQSFSIAGKRQGFADRTRGTLFFEIIRFAEILKPAHLLLENVKGLLNHDGGRTFATIICALDELGYDCEWQLLNSKSYVPQNRERVFIIGHLRGTSGRKVFPITGENSEANCNIAGKLALPGKDQWNRVYHIDGISPTLTTMQGGRQEPKVLVNINHGELKTREDFTCLDANYAKGLDNHAARTGVLEKKFLNQEKFREFKVSDTCQTIRVGGDTALAIEDGHRIRKLTPLECFRLQSFPDEWYYTLKEHGISDSQLYKMAGNAVTSVVAYEIGRRLMGAEPLQNRNE